MTIKHTKKNTKKHPKICTRWLLLTKRSVYGSNPSTPHVLYPYPPHRLVRLVITGNFAHLQSACCDTFVQVQPQNRVANTVVRATGLDSEHVVNRSMFCHAFETPKTFTILLTSHLVRSLGSYLQLQMSAHLPTL